MHASLITMADDRYNIALVGLRYHDRTLLRSLFRVIDGRTPQQWVVDPEAPAHVVIGDTTSPEMQGVPRPPKGPIVINMAANGRTDGADELRLARPIRVNDLVHVLALVGGRLASGATGMFRSNAGGAAPVTVREGELSGTLDSVLRTIVKRTDNNCYRITGDLPVLLVWPAEGRFATPLDNISLSRALAGTGQVHGEALGRDGPGWTLQPGSVRSLRDLLWLAGLHAADAPARFPAGSATRYRLTSWDILLAAPEGRSFISAGAHLQRNALTLDDLALRSGLPQRRLVALLSACELCGCLGVTHDASEMRAARRAATPKREHGVLGILRRIRERLGIEQS